MRCRRSTFSTPDRQSRDAPAENIPVGAGVVVDNDQPYSIFGWLEARWVPIVIL